MPEQKFDESVRGHEGFGLIQVFTGDGKGKTTSAIGTLLRAHAAGRKVGFVYFDKGGDVHYSERKIFDEIDIKYYVTGRDRIHPITNAFDFSIKEIDKKEGKKGLLYIEKMFTEKYDLIVMDEINSSAALGIVSVQAVLNLIDNKPKTTELILTGRNAPNEFLNKANLITEMCLKKHYFYSGVKAREGLDF